MAGRNFSEGRMNYNEFLQRKQRTVQSTGFEVSESGINPVLFPFQRDLVRWAARKGRAAVFADTGLGKTFMQLEWARLSGMRALIIAPLSVARQTVREARKLGLEVIYVRRQLDVEKRPEASLFITNYEMIEQFDFAAFGAVVLDESSILKSLDGKTRQRLTDLTAEVPYKLCCTATPAPNDIAEIGNHSEYLGIKSAVEMKAEFFVHDDDGYRLKGHAETAFFRWLASWGMSVRKPSDIGAYSDEGYQLPPLVIHPVFVKVDYRPEGQLFFTDLGGITGRSDIRKSTTLDRCRAAADLVNATNEQFIVWCGLDAEQETIEKLIPDCVSVYGRHSPDEKAEMLEAFQDGKYRVLITKSKIAGQGMNFQNAHNMVHVGLSDSFEAYYQTIRRCYRFGQKEPVNVWVVLSELEDEIYQNVLRKEREANEMSKKLIENIQHFERAEIQGGAGEEWEYRTDTVKGDNFLMMLGDSCERLAEIETGIAGFSVYSPPFMSLYTYSPTERDLGNSKREEEFFTQYGFIIRELLRITKPGRLTAVHVAQVPAMLVRDGYIGLKDFRGQTIEAYKAAGWIHHGEVVIDKDPQAQAIRTKAKSLLFTQLRKDSSWSRPALADFILLFRKPGENAEPIHPDISNDQWIEWARPIWYGISEGDTLQYTTAREEKDERHICPLQLGTIERCIRLWSNPGDTVVSPFAGIGSEGHVALKFGRKFIGCELKQSYFHVAVRNLKAADVESKTVDLFAWSETQADD
jgi:superfamily II DNA or RNA helicase